MIRSRIGAFRITKDPADCHDREEKDTEQNKRIHRGEITRFTRTLIARCMNGKRQQIRLSAIAIAVTLRRITAPLVTVALKIHRGKGQRALLIPMEPRLG